MTDTRDASALDRILEGEIGIPESVASTMGLDTSGVTVERTLETALGTIDGMTGTRDASALDRILEIGIGIPESVADTMGLFTLDGTGVTTETLGIALGTIGTEDAKPPTPDVATETKLPTSDIATEAKVGTSGTNDERVLGNGRTAVGVTSGVEMGSGAVSLTPVPVPATPEVGRSPLGVMIGLSVTVGIEASTGERSDTRLVLVGMPGASDVAVTSGAEMAVVSPTIIPVGAEEVTGINGILTVLVGRTTLNGRPPVESTATDDSAAASGVLEGRMAKGSPPVELSPASTVDAGRTIDGRPPVEPTLVSAAEVGKLTLGRSVS